MPIPDGIPFALLRDVQRLLGIDIPAVISITVDVNAVTVTAYDLDEGRKYLRPGTSELATKTYTIPVRRTLEAHVA